MLDESTVKIAKMQRLLLIMILVMIVSYIVALVLQQSAFGLLAALPYFVAVIGSFVATILLLSAMGKSVVMIIVCAILLLFPLINLITLLVINGQATKHLQARGLNVGLMGAKV